MNIQKVTTNYSTALIIKYQQNRWKWLPSCLLYYPHLCSRQSSVKSGLLDDFSPSFHLPVAIDSFQVFEKKYNKFFHDCSLCIG